MAIASGWPKNPNARSYQEAASDMMTSENNRQFRETGHAFDMFEIRSRLVELQNQYRELGYVDGRRNNA